MSDIEVARITVIVDVPIPSLLEGYDEEPRDGSETDWVIDGINSIANDMLFVHASAIGRTLSWEIIPATMEVR